LLTDDINGGKTTSSIFVALSEDSLVLPQIAYHVVQITTSRPKQGIANTRCVNGEAQAIKDYR
jgi:hypothetical protein